MRRTGIVASIIIAALSLLPIVAVAAASGGGNVTYACKAPPSGENAVLYRWYVCWPDTNTLTYYKSSSGTTIAIRPKHEGQSMRVQAIDVDGHPGPLSVASDPWLRRALTTASIDGPVPALRLFPNAPNPFNPATTIAFEQPAYGSVRIEIYGLTGGRVRTLLDGVLPAGRAGVIWDGTDDAGRPLASGSYVCRLTAAGMTRTMRMLLVR